MCAMRRMRANGLGVASAAAALAATPGCASHTRQSTGWQLTKPHLLHSHTPQLMVRRFLGSRCLCSLSPHHCLESRCL